VVTPHSQLWLAHNQWEMNENSRAVCRVEPQLVTCVGSDATDIRVMQSLTYCNYLLL